MRLGALSHTRLVTLATFVAFALAVLLMAPAVGAETLDAAPSLDTSRIQLQALLGVAGAPIVMALVSAVVKPFIADQRYWPLAALALGVVWNVGLAYAVHFDPLTAAFLGVLTGLSAAGTYSGAKAMLAARNPAAELASA